MNFWNKETIDVIEELSSSEEKGLTEEEAKERLEKHGLNKLEETHKKSYIKRFLGQFKDIMVIMLIVSAIISGVISYVNSEPFTDTYVILAVITLNAIIGFVQEIKAEKSMDALRKMSKHVAKVIRDRQIKKYKF